MKLKTSDIEPIFYQLTEIEIEAAKDTAKAGDESDKSMAMAYWMAVEQCRKILARIVKDVDEK